MRLLKARMETWSEEAKMKFSRMRRTSEDGLQTKDKRDKPKPWDSLTSITEIWSHSTSSGTKEDPACWLFSTLFPRYRVFTEILAADHTSLEGAWHCLRAESGDRTSDWMLHAGPGTYCLRYRFL